MSSPRMHALVVCTSAVLFVAASRAYAESAERATPAADRAIAMVKVDSHPGADAAPASSPATYPANLADGFRHRAQAVIEAVASGGLDTWRRGYFGGTGGDANKYIIGHAIAKLLVDPDDAESRKYMNDQRIRNKAGLYHFGAVNWARFAPLFGDAVMQEETMATILPRAKRYNFLNPTGTENHKVMWMTSANVLPHVWDVGHNHRSKEDTLRAAKEMLRSYVKGLYAAGQGEWDSSTYLMFDVNGMLNIYDFSPDPEARLLAKAALDWYCTAYALKYREGVYTAPNQRGYASRPMSSIADQTGYIWWGSVATPSADEMRGWRYAMHAVTSSYRPNIVISNLAIKNVQLPAEFRNTKPNYWYGAGSKPAANAMHETVYVAPSYSMGSLWDGYQSQLSRFQIVAPMDSDVLTMTAGHPRRSDHRGVKLDDVGYTDGISRYVQSMQDGPTYIMLAQIPDGEPVDYLFFQQPEDASMTKMGDWWVIEAGSMYVGVRGVGGQTAIGPVDLTSRQKRDNARATERGEQAPHTPAMRLKVTGRQVGWIVETAERSAYPSAKAFANALASRTAVVSAGAGQPMTVRYTSLRDRELTMQFNPDPNGDEHGDRLAVVTIAGQPVDYSRWQVYNGPYIQQRDGVLRVNDGKQGFEITFTEDLPVYRAMTPKSNEVR